MNIRDILYMVPNLLLVCKQRWSISIRSFLTLHLACAVEEFKKKLKSLIFFLQIIAEKQYSLTWAYIYTIIKILTKWVKPKMAPKRLFGSLKILFDENRFFRAFPYGRYPQIFSYKTISYYYHTYQLISVQ